MDTDVGNVQWYLASAHAVIGSSRNDECLMFDSPMLLWCRNQKTLLLYHSCRCCRLFGMSAVQTSCTRDSSSGRATLHVIVRTARTADRNPEIPMSTPSGSYWVGDWVAKAGGLFILQSFQAWFWSGSSLRVNRDRDGV